MFYWIQILALIENSSNIYFYLHSILNYKPKQNKEQNGQLFLPETIFCSIFNVRFYI